MIIPIKSLKNKFNKKNEAETSSFNILNLSFMPYAEQPFAPSKLYRFDELFLKRNGWRLETTVSEIIELVLAVERTNGKSPKSKTGCARA